jgi:hypothetical protein
MATSAPESVHTHSRLDDASFGELTARLTEQVSRLVRDELALAQLEAKEKAKRLGLGVGMFGAGGMLGLLGALCALAAGVLAIAQVLAPWLAALVVAGALLFGAGILAIVGLVDVRRATPPLPTDALASAKTDLAVVREAIHR